MLDIRTRMLYNATCLAPQPPIHTFYTHKRTHLNTKGVHKMAKGKHIFNVLFDNALFDALTALSKRTNNSRGLIVRYAVTYYHAMVMHGTPTCANGQQCFCPQMHRPATPPQPTADSAPIGQQNFTAPGMPAIPPPVFPSPPALIQTEIPDATTVQEPALAEAIPGDVQPIPHSPAN